MVDMHAMKKVELVVDAAAVEDVIDVIEAAGAKGFTALTNVSGRGQRGLRSSGDIFDVVENTYLIVVASPEIASRIVTDALKILENHAGVVWTSDVEVARPDHFR